MPTRTDEYAVLEVIVCTVRRDLYATSDGTMHAVIAVLMHEKEGEKELVNLDQIERLKVA